MSRAVNTLRHKGIAITNDEAQAAECAMLLHDIGHSPFSHALECRLFAGVVHEDISLAMMQQMNTEFGGSLSLAIDIFTNNYHKKFLHQLISSQLDMDRMDYLARDAFFAGVAEGAVGVERIIQMLNVVDNELVIDAKGIHSIEQFLIARRQMYWQVYLHKTVVAAEQLLIGTFRRMQFLLKNKNPNKKPNIKPLPITEPLTLFLKNDYGSNDLNGDMLNLFARVFDGSVDCAIAACTESDDAILRRQCVALTERTLPAIEISDAPFSQEKIDAATTRTIAALGIDSEDAHYFVNEGTLCSRAYSLAGDAIKIRTRNGDVCGVHLASDMLDATAFLHDRVKYFLCWGLQDER
jgi:HD superfamily phosphohydrolase